MGGPPRVAPFVFHEPVGARTDAQGLGRIAAVYKRNTRRCVDSLT